MVVHGIFRGSRSGAIAPLVALMMVVMTGMVAFSIDLGYIAVTRNELQNAADSSSLAGAAKLMSRQAQLAAWYARNNNGALRAYYSGPNEARLEAQRFGQANKGGGVYLTVDLNIGNSSSGDIVLGYIPPTNPMAPMTFDTFPYNSAQVRVYRNAGHSGQLNLFFGRVLGRARQDVTASAIARPTNAPLKVLPITMDINDYRRLIDNNSDNGETDDFTFNPDVEPASPTDFRNRVTGSRTGGGGQPDGIREFRLYPDKGNAPGNFGTVDLGNPNSSTTEIRRQVLNGLSPSDVALMQSQGKLTNGRFVATESAPVNISGDPGVSWSIEQDLQAIVGQMRTIPLYNRVFKQGTIVEYRIVGFVNIVICYADHGPGGKSVIIQPTVPFKIFSSPDENGLGALALVR